MSEIEKQLAQLYQEQQNLSIKMRTEPDLRQKKKLEIEKSQLYKKIQELELERDQLREKQSEKELEKLLKENLMFIFVSANGRKLDISTNLTIQIVYEPCQHKQNINVAELLRNPHFPSNYNLLQTWQRLLREDVTITTTLNCKECEEKKQSKAVKWGSRTPNKPNGRCTIVLRRLQ